MENEVDPIEVDLEQRLGLYMPAMFRLLVDNKLEPWQWENLNKKFLSTHKKRVANQKGSREPLIIESNLYDLIDATFRGQKSALRFVGYVDILFKLLDKNLLQDEKKMIKDTLYNALISHDHQFRNYIGELSVLNKASERRTYDLIGVERDVIASGTTADFTLLNNQTGKTELFEVVNIHFNSTKNLRGRLFKKINEKIKEKTNKQADYTPFTLIPVLWADWKTLKEIEELYKLGKGVEIEGVNEPFALCVFAAENDLPIYRFMTIKKLFPEGQILVNWID